MPGASSTAFSMHLDQEAAICFLEDDVRNSRICISAYSEEEQGAALSGICLLPFSWPAQWVLGPSGVSEPAPIRMLACAQRQACRGFLRAGDQEAMFLKLNRQQSFRQPENPLS
jgi:hypothetical protein